MSISGGRMRTSDKGFIPLTMRPLQFAGQEKKEEKPPSESVPIPLPLGDQHDHGKQGGPGLCEDDGEPDTVDSPNQREEEDGDDLEDDRTHG